MDGGWPEGETRVRRQLSVTLYDRIRSGEVLIVCPGVFFHLSLELLDFPLKFAQRGTVQPRRLSSIILLVEVL